MRGATLEVRLEELGVLRSFSRPRVSNYNPYSESLFRSKEEAFQWVSSFVDWYNQQHRHSGIKFVTPQQRYCGEAIAICKKRTDLYEQACQFHPRRWTTTTRCWRQPEVVWINPPADDFIAQTAKLELAA